MNLHVDTAGTGRDMVLLHGWAMHGALWGELPARLAREYRVHVVDLPGHGFSPDMPSYSLREMAGQLREYLPGGAMVLGWSLGALIALSLAGNAPGQVAGLILVGATPCFCRRDDWLHGMADETFGDFAARLDADPGATVQRFLSLQAIGSREPRAVAQSARARLAERPAARVQALRAGLEILQGVDMRRELDTIDVPACLIHGAGDAVVPLAAARWLAEALPAASLHVLDGAGHAPFLSDPGRVANLVEQATRG